MQVARHEFPHFFLLISALQEPDTPASSGWWRHRFLRVPAGLLQAIRPPSLKRTL